MMARPSVKQVATALAPNCERAHGAGFRADFAFSLSVTPAQRALRRGLFAPRIKLRKAVLTDRSSGK